MKRLGLLLLIFVLTVGSSAAQWHFFDRQLARFEATSQDDFRVLNEQDIIIDRVDGDIIYIYVTPEELATLSGMGYDVYYIPDPTRVYFEELRERTEGSLDELDEYHTYQEMTDNLEAVANDNPDICRLVTAGQSVQGRELWVMEISDNVLEEEDEPEFFYISTMHGDEVVGMENCIEMIHYLVDNYPDDPQVEHLVDDTHIYIMPDMNPDGTAEGVRFNANGHDLNRSFPDRIEDPYITAVGRPVEVRVLMNFFATHSPVLAANFHGGAIVVNYPYDNNPTGSNVYTACPDDEWYIAASLAYADLNDSLRNSTEFENGITNGADWYAISGGMQDYTYDTYDGCFHVTIELSHVKWPPEDELPEFWDMNRESMLAYMEYVHQGIRGVVTDALTGQPLEAIITIDDNPIEMFTDPDVGDYYRLALPGTYTLNVYSYGYEPFIQENVTVTEAAYTRVDVELQRAAEGYVFDDLEGSTEDYTHSAVTPGDEDQWHLSGSRTSTPFHSWKCGDEGGGNHASNMDAGLVTPVYTLQPNSVLSFWHYIDSEVSATYYPYAYDGGIVEISTNGGDTWTQIEPVGEYPFLIRNTSGNGPLPHDTPCFAGHIRGREAIFDLSDYSGDVQFRFRFVSDGSVNREGWYIDDIELRATEAAPLLSVSADLLDFPDTVEGHESELLLTVSNLGTADLMISSLEPLAGIAFSTNWIAEDSLIAPGQGIDVTVTFLPPDTLDYADTLRILSNGGDADVILNGTGTPDTGTGNGGQFVPVEYALRAPYPNPFNQVARITYNVAERGNVQLILYDVAGREVRRLINHVHHAGVHSISMDSDGLATGMYFLEMQADGFRQVRKLILLK